MSTETQQYELKGVSFTEVTKEIEKVWGEMQQSDSAGKVQIDPDEFEELKKRSVDEVLVLDKGASFAVEATLIVAFAPVAAKITKDIWDHIILPRLIRRFGSDAITPQKDKK